ncbi:MAG: ROK family protein [Ardenticatenaceae bacterium]|nr:ROK family protein [Ardenticatenaceae bacterium]
MEILGIDIGGSGIKGALVDIETGELTTDRLRIDTPQPSKPNAVIEVVTQIVRQFDYKGPIGVGFPAIVIQGVTRSAANVDDGWINYPAAEKIAKATGCQVVVRNDADVAALAEVRFGAGQGQMGSVMVFTLGTGIGSSMFVDGKLVPNMEFGHVYLPGHKKDVEYYAADRIRKKKKLSWEEWGQRLNVYFQFIESLFSPELIIIGGGVSKNHQKFLHYIDVQAKVVPAALRNEAGIVGAALTAVA